MIITSEENKTSSIFLADIQLKEEAERLMKIKGNIKGEALRAHAAYINYKKGEDGVSKMEEKMKELGYPLIYKNIEPLKWYPEAFSVICFLVAKNVFNWKDSDIFDMGNSAPKYSFIVKLLFRYFISIQKTFFEESPKYWAKHFDFGSLEAVEFNKEKQYSIIRIIGYKFHPISCIYFSGYFSRIAQFITKSDKITIEETKCVHKGDLYDEYIIKWQ